MKVLDCQQYRVEALSEPGMPRDALHTKHRDDYRFVQVGDWMYIFGEQVGLGGFASRLSTQWTRVISIHNEDKRGVVLCAVYESGEIRREISSIESSFHEEGQAFSAEPELAADAEGVVCIDDSKVLQFSRAWGADPSELRAGAAVTLAASPQFFQMRLQMRRLRIIVMLMMICALVTLVVWWITNR